jgi:hypothetical protein
MTTPNRIGRAVHSRMQPGASTSTSFGSTTPALPLKRLVRRGGCFRHWRADEQPPAKRLGADQRRRWERSGIAGRLCSSYDSSA